MFEPLYAQAGVSSDDGATSLWQAQNLQKRPVRAGGVWQVTSALPLAWVLSAANSNLSGKDSVHDVGT